MRVHQREVVPGLGLPRDGLDAGRDARPLLVVGALHRVGHAHLACLYEGKGVRVDVAYRQRPVAVEVADGQLPARAVVGQVVGMPQRKRRRHARHVAVGRVHLRNLGLGGVCGRM